MKTINQRATPPTGCIVFAAVLASLCAGCSRKPPAAPAEVKMPDELKRLACVHDGYDVYKMGATTLIAPCALPGTEEKVVKKRLDGPDRQNYMAWSKDHEGQLHAGTTDLPKIYHFSATFREKPPVMLPDLGWYKKVKNVDVAIPRTFTRTPATATFHCALTRGRRLTESEQLCFGIVRAAALEWSVQFQFFHPLPDDDSVASEMGDAMRVLAAHIVSQP